MLLRLLLWTIAKFWQLFQSLIVGPTRFTTRTVFSNTLLNAIAVLALRSADEGLAFLQAWLPTLLQATRELTDADLDASAASSALETLESIRERLELLQAAGELHAEGQLESSASSLDTCATLCAPARADRAAVVQLSCSGRLPYECTRTRCNCIWCCFQIVHGLTCLQAT